MILKSILIKNYKSIKELKVDLKHNLNIFIGINESGKSSILQAIKMLNKDADYKYSRDSTFELEETLKPNYSEFHFTFQFDEDDKREIIGNLFKGYNDTPTTLESSTMEEVLSSEHTISIIYNEKNERKEFLNSEIKDERINLKQDFLRIKDTSENVNFSVMVDGQSIKFQDLKYFDSKRCRNLDAVANHTEPLRKDIFVEDIKKKVLDLIQKNRPNVIYWKYDEKYLLPSQVNIQEFKNNPDICIPLKLFFNLAGSSDIKGTIEAKLNDPTRFRTLTSIIGKKATEHIKKVWPEFKDLSIEVGYDTQNITVGILESGVLFPMDARSDGFKRFVSFITTISAQTSTGQMKNKILILDEPDVSLHPTGIRAFLGELIRISKNNFCFVATHSIFMIDPDKIDRHFVVKKDDNITYISNTTEENFTQEEVLFNALGYSLYEIVKHKNLMLEGYIDKELIKKLNELLKNKSFPFLDLEKIGLIWGGGVNNIQPSLRLLESTNRKVLITVDSDDAGIREKQALISSSPELDGAVYTFEEIVRSGKKSFTIEDFLPSSWVVDVLNKHLKDKFGDKKVPNFNYGNQSIGILEEWRIFVNKNFGGDRELLEGFKNKIPSYVHNKLRGDAPTNVQIEFKRFIDYVNFVNSKFNS